MRKYVLYAFIFILGAYLFFHQRKNKELPANETAAEIAELGPTALLFKKASEFRGLTRSSQTAAHDTTPCQRWVDVIETQAIETSFYDLKNAKLVIPSNCPSDPRTLELFAKLKEVCDFSKGQASERRCRSKLFHYRARRIQLATDGKNPKDLSTDILAQRFFGLLTSNSISSSEGAKDARGIAAELRERMPNSTSPDKMEIAGYLMDPNFSNEMKPGLYNAIAIARQKNPADWGLFEIEQAQLSQNGTPEAYRKLVTDFYNSNQQNPIAVYHMGCMTWKFGDANSALQYLNQAAALAPQEIRFAKTVIMAKESVPPTKICTYSISFRPQDF